MFFGFGPNLSIEARKSKSNEKCVRSYSEWNVFSDGVSSLAEVERNRIHFLTSEALEEGSFCSDALTPEQGSADLEMPLSVCVLDTFSCFSSVFSVFLGAFECFYML